MIRPERLWPVLTLAALIVLPWYGIEDGSVLLRLQPDAMPAVVQMLGRAWLVPLLAAPVLALWGGFLGRPRVLVAAGVVGLLWLTLEGLAINHRGWAWAALAALGPAPTQHALGWGALAYAWCCAMLAAVGLARLGRCRGDIFVTGAILLTGLSLLVFIFAPLMSVFSSAVRDQAGHIDLVLFWNKLTHGSIWDSTASPAAPPAARRGTP